MSDDTKVLYLISDNCEIHEKDQKKSCLDAILILSCSMWTLG